MARLEPEFMIARGLLPENLPPTFSSDKLWSALDGDTAGYRVSGSVTGQACVYNASKRGGHRRTFSLPHPLFVREQAIFLREHWAHISDIFDGASGSVSRPIIDHAGPRSVRITSHQDLPRLQLQRLSRFRYCLVTDVSRFYSSIYTHALPWAINGKAAAKADQSTSSSTVFGNRLDFALRQSQAKQTIGIAVGPDTCKVIAEILMSAVDRRFIELSGSKPPAYLRHVDDYWIGGNSVEACEKHLQNLRLAMREYELDINEAKTITLPTQQVFRQSWSSGFERDIRDALRPSGRRAGSDIVSVVGSVIEQAARGGDDGIIKRAVRVIDEQKLWSADWELLEHFLVQCAVQFPHSIDYVARVVAWRVRTGQPTDQALWVEVAHDLALRSARVGHDSEVAWSLYLLKELDQKVTKALSDAVLANNSALVTSLLAHFSVHGLAADSRLRSTLSGVVDGDPYAGPHWPLALELNHLSRKTISWALPAGSPALRTLQAARASMIRWTAPPKVFNGQQAADGDARLPATAIEDFGSDYRGDGAQMAEIESSGKDDLSELLE